MLNSGSLSSNSSGCFKEYAISHLFLVSSGRFLISPPFYLAFEQTLDAFTSHLPTPFNGPVPPSNISDKIAQSRQAKGPADWLHSQCPTRAKTIELRKALPSL